MKKKVFTVPAGARYVTEFFEWMPEEPYIIDKKICGCGFTEWVITNQFNVILLSPRRILLENKKDQHPEQNVYYFKNDGGDNLTYDQDIRTGKKTKGSMKDNAERLALMKTDVQNHFQKCIMSEATCKILCTYDSFRHVKDALGRAIYDFNIVVDEFQSIWIDSRFKSETEMELLDQLADLRRISFVSATPMIEKYLEQLDEFKNLPYLEFDWETEEPGRVKKPDIGEPHACKSVFQQACRIVSEYQAGRFEYDTWYDDNHNCGGTVPSKEAVFYVNSVNMICRIIKKCELTLANTNVLCARTDENKAKLRAVFGLTKSDPEYENGGIGTVPKLCEPHKMFTLCTRTVYLGADFYSFCARSFVFSDANIDSMAVDISLDLPQILGRQRNFMNPWKNRAEFYYTTFKNGDKMQTLDEFKRKMMEKNDTTERLLKVYQEASDDCKSSLAQTYETVALVNHYRDDYVSVNKHAGSGPVPVFNKLVQLGELRTYELQQIDYKNWFSVFANLSKQAKAATPEMTAALEEFNRNTQFSDKMRILCNCPEISDRVPREYSKYLDMLSPEVIRACEYRKCELDRRIYASTKQDDVTKDVIATFKVGERYTNADVKTKLQAIFNRHGVNQTATASKIRQWFLAGDCTITVNGERVNGLLISGYHYE